MARRRTRRTAVWIAGAAGAAAQYLLDPEQGKRRRNVARDRARALLRRRARDVARQAQYAEGVARGVVHEATKRVPTGGDGQPLDDVTLARKVETEIFRDADAPKGTVSINAEGGVVYLRGQLDSSEEIERLADRAREVEGVADVKNLMHLPGTPAPTSEDARAQSAAAGQKDDG